MTGKPRTHADHCQMNYDYPDDYPQAETECNCNEPPPEKARGCGSWSCKTVEPEGQGNNGPCRCVPPAPTPSCPHGSGDAVCFCAHEPAPTPSVEEDFALIQKVLKSLTSLPGMFEALARIQREVGELTERLHAVYSCDRCKKPQSAVWHCRYCDPQGVTAAHRAGMLDAAEVYIPIEVASDHAYDRGYSNGWRDGRDAHQKAIRAKAGGGE